jgi:preprotein translocase subunit SecA
MHLTMNPAMDATLARKLAGSAWTRADARRDERGPETDHALEKWLRDLPGWWPARPVSGRQVARTSDRIRVAADALRAQPDERLAEAFHHALQAIKAGEHLPKSSALQAHWDQVWACVGLASQRRLGMWPHGVQFVGAGLLLHGRLAEMRTGEGKTLVAAMAATVMAGSGARAHVVSTNDYLAQRDSEEMAPLFGFFGLGVGHVVDGMLAGERRQAYRQSVCYVSGKELVFDYLKDTLSGHGVTPWRVSCAHQAWVGDLPGRAAAEPPLIPALHFAIVDEADSVLIDEASTPMILSREVPGQYEPDLMLWAVEAARGFQAGRHYVMGAGRRVEVLPMALDAAPPLPAGVGPMWQARSWREMLLRQALTALHLFHRDQHYLVSAEGKVQIVDESTGRLMPDRSWEQGLHQMIEAKEGVAQTAGRDTLARMTFQRFFPRYYLLSGLTGTAREASRELWSVYRLAVQPVPPNRPDRRQVLPPRCLPSEAAKWRAVCEDASRAARAGQAVLIGTRSVEASERVSAALLAAGVPHVVLNARQDAQEAEVVAQAGRSGQITVATNMAGRGTDIRLDEAARAAGGLHVILTEFHDSPRVDRQLFGRCGRQGDPGSVRVMVSTQDTLWRNGSSLWHALAMRAGPVGALALAWHARWAQSQAERRGRIQRQQTMQQDRQLKKLIGFAGPV